MMNKTENYGVGKASRKIKNYCRNDGEINSNRLFRRIQSFTFSEAETIKKKRLREVRYDRSGNNT